MDRSTSRLSHWIYYLAAALFYAATYLRTLVIFRYSASLSRAQDLLLVVLALFLSEPLLTRRWKGYFSIYLLVQTVMVFFLLSLSDTSEYFAILLGVLSMQVMLNLSPRLGAGWIAVCAIFMALLLAEAYGLPQAIAFTLIFTAINVFMGTYALTARRQQAAHREQVQLAHQLRQANQQLEEYSSQLEQLAVVRERNRFARELHDSVTQTVFSMTLATQSAMLLLKRDLGQVKPQLERLEQLVQAALSEMQSLITTLKPEAEASAGLVAGLRHQLSAVRLAQSLSVDLQVTGEQALSPPEEQALLGIAGEALNNIVKHAQTDRAQIRVHLEEPFWMEVEDQGQGFDLARARENGRLGLTSMRERAAEIGWSLQVSSSPGAGTCIRVEKVPVREEQ
jgi:signal transduction histidine kinase